MANAAAFQELEHELNAFENLLQDLRDLREGLIPLHDEVTNKEVEDAAFSLRFVRQTLDTNPTIQSLFRHSIRSSSST